MMTRKIRTAHKTRPIPSTDGTVAARSPAETPHHRAILDITDDLMNTESVLATAIVAVDADGVDPEDVKITLVIVRERLHAAMERVRALRD